jgi:hypothetical protein
MHGINCRIQEGNGGAMTTERHGKELRHAAAQVIAAATVLTGRLCLQPGTTSRELTGSQSLDPKVVQFLAGPELHPQPAGLFATAGPGLHGIVRILIFRENFWVRATLVQRTISGTKFMQAVVKLVLLMRYLAAQFSNH